MGKGVALEFKKAYPTMFEDYAARCMRKQVRLGEPYLYRDPGGAMIVNFPTKDHWRSASRLADMNRGLDYFVAHAEEWGVQSVAFPPLGCGNGGLDWSEVGPLIYSKLRDADFDVEVYAPYGTPKNELTLDFLGANSQMSLSGKGRRQRSLILNGWRWWRWCVNWVSSRTRIRWGEPFYKKLPTSSRRREFKPVSVLKKEATDHSRMR